MRASERSGHGGARRRHRRCTYTPYTTYMVAQIIPLNIIGSFQSHAQAAMGLCRLRLRPRRQATYLRTHSHTLTHTLTHMYTHMESVRVCVCVSVRTRRNKYQLDKSSTSQTELYTTHTHTRYPHYTHAESMLHCPRPCILFANRRTPSTNRHRSTATRTTQKMRKSAHD